MKKLLVASSVAATVALGFGGAASADGHEAYPPAAPVEPAAPTPAPPAMLPQTGSDSVSTTLAVGGGLLAMGIGLAGVAAMRRRQDFAVA